MRTCNHELVHVRYRTCKADKSVGSHRNIYTNQTPEINFPFILTVLQPLLADVVCFTLYVVTHNVTQPLLNAALLHCVCDNTNTLSLILSLVLCFCFSLCWSTNTHTHSVQHPKMNKHASFPITDMSRWTGLRQSVQYIFDSGLKNNSGEEQVSVDRKSVV